MTAGSNQQTLLFRVTNTGNGADTFKLADSLMTPGGTIFTPAGCLVYFDTANTGVYRCLRRALHRRQQRSAAWRRTWASTC